jgi:hypothetical protein
VTGPRRLAVPRPVAVAAGPGGAVRAVRGIPVESVLEEWVVEDRWWSTRPLRRRYLELVLADGRCVVVFRDLATGRWHEQRG